MTPCRCGGGGAQEFADLGPGEFLVAGGADGFGQELLGLGDEARQGVQVDGGVAEPVGGAQPGEVVRNREWSSMILRISALAPPASCQWVMSICHRSFGRSAQNRV